jgi:endo-1,4-beta-xylanase
MIGAFAISAVISAVGCSQPLPVAPEQATSPLETGQEPDGGDPPSTGGTILILVTPSSATLIPGQSRRFDAVTLDETGNPVPSEVVWTATGGVINSDGSYTAGLISGDFSVVASVESTSDTTRVAIRSLRDLATSAGIEIGAAAEPQPIDADLVYAEVLAREFSMLATENAMKLRRIQRERGTFDFREPDKLVEFAAANDMAVRGHTLVWHEFPPDWLVATQWTKEDLTNVLRDHVHTVVGRYTGKVPVWDVVNEAIDGDSLRYSTWLENIGPEYIGLSFRWAHEADPEALLFYNDFGAEGLGAKSDAVYNLVADLLDRGVPIHGVGLQMHVSLEWPLELDEIRANMERLGALGLIVHITEMDVRLEEPATEADLAAQAAVYRDVLSLCLEVEACQALVTWGVSDGRSWIPQRFPGYGSALLFDAGYSPKPAYQELLKELAGR